MKYLALFKFLLCGRPGRSSPQFGWFSFSFFFLVNVTRAGLVVGIRWSVYISKSQRSLYISFVRTDSGLGIYHLAVWSNSNYLHNFQYITFITKSWLLLYSFCAGLLDTIIIRLILSSLSLLLSLFAWGNVWSLKCSCVNGFVLLGNRFLSLIWGYWMIFFQFSL